MSLTKHTGKTQCRFFCEKIGNDVALREDRLQYSSAILQKILVPRALLIYFVYLLD